MLLQACDVIVIAKGTRYFGKEPLSFHLDCGARSNLRRAGGIWRRKGEFAFDTCSDQRIIAMTCVRGYTEIASVRTLRAMWCR